VAVTQITAISQTMIRQLPPGISPPLIITYSASSVPVLQLGMRGQGLSEQSYLISERIWFAISWQTWPERRFRGPTAGNSASFSEH